MIFIGVLVQAFFLADLEFLQPLLSSSRQIDGIPLKPSCILNVVFCGFVAAF